MQILVITNYYPPFSKGGYETSCKDVCDYLAENHTLHVLTGDYVPKDKRINDVFKYSVTRNLRYIDYLNGGYLQKLEVEKDNYSQTKQLIESIKPDIVYIWNQQGISLAPLLAAQDSKMPIVFDFGDFWYRVYLRDGIGDKIKRFAKNVMPFVISGKPKWGNLISVSHWMAEELTKELQPQKIQVIPRGIDIAEVKPSQKNPEIFRLMFSGRIDKKKGLDLCIESINILKQENPEVVFEFNIFGTGDEDYLLICRKLIEKYNLEDSIHFKGRVEDIYQEYSTHHILLMPTLATETFGRVIIEAMAHEAVVIATNNYGPSEIIDSGTDGYLIPPGDFKEMTRIIVDLHGNIDKMNSIAKTAKIKIINMYNLNRINELREKVLQEEVINHA